MRGEMSAVARQEDNPMQTQLREDEQPLVNTFETVLAIYLGDISKIDRTETPQVQQRRKELAAENLEALKNNLQYKNLEPGERFQVVLEALERLVEDGTITEKNLEVTKDLETNLLLGLEAATSEMLNRKNQREISPHGAETVVDAIEKPASLMERIQTEITYATNVLRLNSLSEAELDEISGRRIEKIDNEPTQKNIDLLTKLVVDLNNFGGATLRAIREQQKNYDKEELAAFKARLTQVDDLLKQAKQKLKENQTTVAARKQMV